jgi:hypothetical protein
MDAKGSIKPADVLTVRECGNQLVESFRQRAIKVGGKERDRAGQGVMVGGNPPGTCLSCIPGAVTAVTF